MRLLEIPVASQKRFTNTNSIIPDLDIHVQRDLDHNACHIIITYSALEIIRHAFGIRFCIQTAKQKTPVGHLLVK